MRLISDLGNKELNIQRAAMQRRIMCPANRAGFRKRKLNIPEGPVNTRRIQLVALRD